MGLTRSPNFVSGSAGWQIEADGSAEFNDVVVRGTIYADVGEIGGWTIETGHLYAGTGEGRVGLQPGSWPFYAGSDTPASADFRVNTAGEVWALNVNVRGSLRAGVFVKDLISAHAGSLLVVKSAGKVSADYTVGGTLTVETPPGGGWLFDNSDVVRLKEEYAGGVYETWITVTRSATTNEYTTSRQSGDDGVTYHPGTAAVDYGVSGDGGLLQTADAAGAPYLSVFTHAGAPWTTTTERVRLGNLNGLADYGADAYGIFVGDYAGNKWLAYDPTKSLRIRGDALIEGTVTADKLNIGEFLYNSVDGLLLLGPHCYISPTEWRSLRKQKATLSGGFHTVQGMWQGTRGIVIEEATTNLVVNPSFEIDVTNWTNAGFDTWERITTDSVFGTCCGRMYEAAIEADEYIFPAEMPATAGLQYTLSAYIKKVKCTGAGIFRIIWRNAAHGTISVSDLTLDSGIHGWKRYTKTATAPVLTAYALVVAFYAAGCTAGTEMEVLIDGVQFEQKGYPTSYCDGSLGSGYAWTGTAHASTSARAVNECNLDALVGLISSKNTMSFRVAVQYPYAATAVWPVATPNAAMWATGGVADYINIYFDTTDDSFKAGARFGADMFQLSSSAQTFAAGTWIDLVLTLDFTANSFKFYVNGVLEDTDTTACGAPVLNQWNLGSNCAGVNLPGAAFCEFGVFDRVLDQSEVSQLFELQQPLVDTGSMEAPGIYIMDGQFKIASGTSGQRIEITAAEIAGYNSAGTKQFYLQSSDGQAMAGGGAVILNSAGFEVHTTGEANIFSKWFNSEITTYTSAFGFANLQKTDPDSHTYGAMNFGVRHNASNQSGIACWLNEVDVTIQKAAAWRTVLESNYDKVRVVGVPFRVGTGTADPTVGVENGVLFYRTDTNKLRLRAGGAWVDLN
ncbi:MAG TPA: LamG-like jellyroll fold domain-containing protein [Anaerolineae bacterium]|nr:LamG-like jellyroll fold domain-containing protein [Anaerolineae bacterium]